MSVYDRDYMRPGRSPWNFKRVRWTAFGIVFWLNIAVFVLQFFGGFFVERGMGGTMPKGGVSLDLLSQGWVLSVFTYMFVHGSPGHLLLNLLMLWFAGRQIQQIFGGAHFLRIYLLGGIFGAALEILVRSWIGMGDVYLVGASASIFALFTALAVTMPNEVFTALVYFIIPVRVRMWKLAAVAIGLNLVFGVLGLFWAEMPGSEVAYFAHLGGALTGWYYIRLLGFGGNPLTYSQLWRRSSPGQASQPTPGRPTAANALEMARSRKRRLSVDLELDHDAIRRRQTSNDPKVDLIREEVDPILDKISEQGLNSLTDDERRVLERASRFVARPKAP